MTVSDLHSESVTVMNLRMKIDSLQMALEIFPCWIKELIKTNLSFCQFLNILIKILGIFLVTENQILMTI